ncbi:MAG TPA: UvrD-helicase domain-containing protein [Methylotenera sp.]|nr:UvrD-helicase domain-containing protein [Methylotenera sp.]
MSNTLHFISAGAGSGKTYRLTQILHAKLSAGEIRPSGVIATTFTRKAATELRERVRAHLLEKGAYKIANAMGQARINTVNGVCGDLLLRFAFEAGMSTEQQVLEEEQEKALLNEAIDSVMDGEEISKLLAIVRRMEMTDWKADLANLIKQARANDIDISLLSGFSQQNADGLLAYFPKCSNDDLTGNLIQVIRNELPELEKGAEEGGLQNTNKYLVLVKDVRDKLLEGEASWSDWVRLAAGAPEKGLVHIAERIGVVANRYVEHPQLHNDVRDYLQTLFMLCEKALQAYADRKLEMGVLDFTDQELLLLRTLDNETVADTLREELDLLMVDEFQDTSPIQLALFLKLAELAKEIYWVGDIKQAIYGFRGSDTTLMKAILDVLTNMGGDKEVLDKSWRSRSPLVSLVNEIFVPAFANSLQADDVRLTAERNEPLTGAAFANWKLSGSNADKRNSALVSGVRQLVDSGYIVHDKPAKLLRPICYGDIAILSRSNAGVIGIASVLRAQGIPVAIAQPGLMRTPEAVLATACLRRLNDPSDTIASAEIVSLAGCEEPEVWVADRLKLMATAPEDRPSGYGNNWREVGDNIFPLLAELAILRADMPILSPLEAMQAVVAHGQLSSIVLRWCKNEADARSRLANLEALLGMARQYEETSRNTSQSASVSGLILWLNEQAEAELDMLALPAVDAVQVMTHHRAKGLEWPVVILTDLEKKIRDRLWSITTISQSAVDVQRPLQNRFVRFWPWPFGKMEKVTIADKIDQSEIAKRFYAAAVDEEKRLLYVSMTRARDLLVLAHGGKETEVSWIKTIDADWLQGEVEATTLELPSGETIPYQGMILEPNEADADHQTEVEPIHWFKEFTSSGKVNTPLKFTPSSVEQQNCTIEENIAIGNRMTLKPGVDMAQLGTALHGCIGASFTDPATLLTSEEIEALLQRMGVGGVIQPQELLSQLTAFSKWIKARWPEAVPYAEVPTEMKMPNGQILHGRIDLLLKVNNGWILIDHKSNPGGSDRWDSVAQENIGQLAAYKDAVECACGEKVLESWLFLPISAIVLKLSSIK